MSASNQRRQRPRWRALVAGTGLVLAGIAAIDRWGAIAVEPLLMQLKTPLENRFPRARLADGDLITGIIALGGHTARAREAMRLAKQFPGARVLLSGVEEREKAVVLAAGLPASRLRFDDRAGNTYENAVFTRQLVEPRPGERWILVTSALHMPRAIGTFAAVGFPVEAWPVDDALPERRYAAPVVLHELQGLVTYWLMGRTRALFPGPPG